MVLYYLCCLLLWTVSTSLEPKSKGKLINFSLINKSFDSFSYKYCLSFEFWWRCLKSFISHDVGFQPSWSKPCSRAVRLNWFLYKPKHCWQGLHIWGVLVFLWCYVSTFLILLNLLILFCRFWNLITKLQEVRWTSKCYKIYKGNECFIIFYTKHKELKSN